VLVGATPATQTVACDSGLFSAVFDVTAIPDGAANISVDATQEDAAGNEGVAANVTALKDTTAPTITFTELGAGVDNIISAAEASSVVIAGVSNDTEDGNDVSLSITNGADSITIATTVNVDGDWSTSPVDLSAFADGDLVYTVAVTDNAGNESAPDTANVSLNALPPMLTAQTNSPGFDTTPEIIGTTDQPDGALVEVTDADFIPLCSAVVSNGAWSCEITTPLVDGSYNLVASTEDSLSNETSVPLSLEIGADVDTDADGIPDIDEGTEDTDGDGEPDYRDTDTDNDGTPDVVEATTDDDGDNVPAYKDLDSDNDGIPDAVEGSDDADNDGIPNYRDLDSDNDGLPDFYEAGIAVALDTDADGRVDGAVGENGLPDAVESSIDSDVVDYDGDGNADLPRNSDNDAVADYLDVDSDNDGLVDLVEAGGVDADADGRLDLFVDTVEDGWHDDNATDFTAPQDFDEDALADVIDPDSDNDGIPDLVEIGGVDTDGDAAIDGFTDTDGDGLHDPLNGDGFTDLDSDSDSFANRLDVDADNDGLNDSVEGAADTDMDGTPDFLDLDSDADGTSDSIEGLEDFNGDGVPDYIDDSIDPDVDGDGIPNAEEGMGDGDGDGISNFEDPDADGDGLPDAIESVVDTDGDGTPDYLDEDSDGDGITDANEGGNDQDGDGVPNYLDPDADGDGINDADEGIIDSDADGTPDFLDNGTEEVVPTGDLDGDGIINSEDPDIDGDGIDNDIEGLVDTDGDGTPDMLDFDSDGDGIVDFFESAADADGDGIPNYLDTDADGDGIADATEGRGDPDGDGISNYLDTDADGDGIADSVETDVDTDADGLADFLDLDADGDTTPDNIEGNVDADGNGVPDFQEFGGIADTDGDGLVDILEGDGDADGDGQPNYIDTDSDGDGIDDVVEGNNDSDADGTPDYLDLDADDDGLSDAAERTTDTDGDGLPDYLDRDSDGDGITDEQETDIDTDGDGIINALDLDSENDGISDAIEGARDNDGDGVYNAIDLDSDNDGLLDMDEGIENARAWLIDGASLASDEAQGPVLAAARPIFMDGTAVTQIDDNGNGWDDRIEAQQLGPFDTDIDFVPDFLDIDSDNDSITDAVEADATDADKDGQIDNFRDRNGNGYDDALEVAPLILVDTDSDGLFDHHDSDSDQDGLPDIIEVLGEDRDRDGYVDDFVDENDDGLSDVIRLVPAVLVDSDSDQTPDFREVDSDNDGLTDLVEIGGADVNGDGIVDTLTDTDLDGIPDSVDVDQTGGSDADNDGIDDSADVDFAAGGDEDRDGIIDARDPDADGNGLADITAPLLVAALPDSNGDNIPDYQQALRTGKVKTGVYGNGVGCSVIAAPAGRSIDPMLPLLLLAALVGLMRRVARQRLLSSVYRAWRAPAFARANCFCSPRRTTLAQRIVLFAIVAATLSACSLPGGSRRAEVADHTNVAGSQDEFKRRFYAGVGLGVSSLNPVTDDTEFTVSGTGGGAFHLHAGMDVSPRIGAELHYGSLGEATLEPEGSIAYSAVGASALVYSSGDRDRLSMRRGLMGYLRGGLAALSTSAADVEIEQLNSVQFLVGVGAEYGFDNGLAVRGELLSYDGDARAGQLALVYRFGTQQPAKQRQVAPRPTPQKKPKKIQRAPVPEKPKPQPKVQKPVEKPAPVVAPKPKPKPLPKPDVDSDGDGVFDKLDECPTTARGSEVNKRGCALLEGVLEGVQFESSSDKLRPSAQDVLNRVAAKLVENPSIRVQLAAHTDSSGSSEANKLLSRKRVVSVARYLISRGVPQKQLVARAFGDTRPIASNDTIEGRARNRRVEITTLADK